jgi:hypothetical protein
MIAVALIYLSLLDYGCGAWRHVMVTYYTPASVLQHWCLSDPPFGDSTTSIARSTVYLYLMLLAGCVARLTLVANEPAHLRLAADLDRPEDGYCFDIPGAGQNLRVDLPLFAHNCKTAFIAAPL